MHLQRRNQVCFGFFFNELFSAFVLLFSIPLQTCDSHKSLVKVRRFQEEQEKTIILYHCAAATSNEWCGSWEVVSEEVEVGVVKLSVHVMVFL